MGRVFPKSMMSFPYYIAFFTFIILPGYSKSDANQQPEFGIRQDSSQSVQNTSTPYKIYRASSGGNTVHTALHLPNDEEAKFLVAPTTLVPTANLRVHNPAKGMLSVDWMAIFGFQIECGLITSLFVVCQVY